MALNITLEEADAEDFRRRLLAIHKRAISIEEQMATMKVDALALRSDVNAHPSADATDVQVVTDELVARRSALIAAAQAL